MNKIALSPNMVRVEGVAIEAINPGRLLKITTSGFSLLDSASDEPADLIIAEEMGAHLGGGIYERWAAGDTLVAVQPSTNERVQALVSAGVIANGAALCHATSGVLRPAVIGTDFIIAYAAEAKTIAGVAELMVIHKA